ncbi:MAG: MlaD family protein [Gordonia sp. (in: high G+C Gram-positive bacteria)]
MPPLSRLVKIQLVVVLVLGVLASAYGAVRYARMGEAVGVGVYKVTVHAKDSGGLFEEAQVTYLGVPVGRVDAIRLTSSGVDVDLVLQKDAGDIPEKSVASVSNRSAIGEQYLDLQAAVAGGPYLHDGSQIEGLDLPPQIQDVLNSAVTLSDSVPADDLHTVVTELGKAFDGQGDNLSRLIGALMNLSKTGHDNLDQTIGLIQNSNVVLGTQADQSDAILDWSENLDKVAVQLAASDPAVRRILTNAPPAATSLSSFLQHNGGDATTLIHQLGETAHTIEPATFSTGYVFFMLSSLSAGSHTTASSDGTIHFGLVLETGNPPSCTRGYEGTQALIAQLKKSNPKFDLNYDDFPFNKDAECSVPVGNPTGVRSADRAALADPAHPQPWDGKPKKASDSLDLNPLATRLGILMGVHQK